MKIAAVNFSHNGSLCYLEEGDIVFYIEEARLSRKKEDAFPYFSLHRLKEHTGELDVLAVCGLESERFKYSGSVFGTLAEKIGIECGQVVDLGSRHHLLHAACGFYSSGFDEAACVIVDGGGATAADGRSERETIFRFRYPCDFQPVFKTWQTGPESVGMVFEMVSLFLGFGPRDAGKVMGLSSYGMPDEGFPPVYHRDPDGEWVKNPDFSLDHPYLNQDDFQVKANLAYSVQTTTGERVLQLIDRALERTSMNNVVLSGGYALNCVNNYKYVEAFPGVRFYIDPVGHDGGTAIGAVKLMHHRSARDARKRPLETLYLGC